MFLHLLRWTLILATYSIAWCVPPSASGSGLTISDELEILPEYRYQDSYNQVISIFGASAGDQFVAGLTGLDGRVWTYRRDADGGDIGGSPARELYPEPGIHALHGLHHRALPSSSEWLLLQSDDFGLHLERREQLAPSTTAISRDGSDGTGANTEVLDLPDSPAGQLYPGAAALAANERASLVAWIHDGFLRVVRVGAGFESEPTPLALPAENTTFGLVLDSRGGVLVWAMDATTRAVLLIDEEGHVVPMEPILSPYESEITQITAARIGDGWLLAAADREHVHVSVLEADGSTRTGTNPLSLPERAKHGLVAASSGDEALVCWRGSTIRAARFGTDGSPQGVPWNVGSGVDLFRDHAGPAKRLDCVWNGQSYVVLWNSFFGRTDDPLECYDDHLPMSAAWISRDGRLERIVSLNETYEPGQTSVDVRGSEIRLLMKDDTSLSHQLLNLDTATETISAVSEIEIREGVRCESQIVRRDRLAVRAGADFATGTYLRELNDPQDGEEDATAYLQLARIDEGGAQTYVGTAPGEYLSSWSLAGNQDEVWAALQFEYSQAEWVDLYYYREGIRFVHQLPRAQRTLHPCVTMLRDRCLIAWVEQHPGGFNLFYALQEAPQGPDSPSRIARRAVLPHPTGYVEPAVAAAPDHAVCVFLSRNQLWGARFDAEGNVLDETPIPLADVRVGSTDLSVTWSGQLYFITWIEPAAEGGKELHFARLASDGRVFLADDSILAVDAEGPVSLAAESGRIAVSYSQNKVRVVLDDFLFDDRDHLLYFRTLDATPIVDGVRLRWTLYDQVPDRFRLERAPADAPDTDSFASIAEIDTDPDRDPGADPREFEFVDRNVYTGTEYLYRVIGTFANGAIKTAGPVRARVPAPTTFEVTLVGSNPASLGSHIVYRLPSAGSVDLGVFDANGRKVAAARRAEDAGVHEWCWTEAAPQGSLASGVYWIRVAYAETERLVRAILIR